jgi:hypothetical protein
MLSGYVCSIHRCAACILVSCRPYGPSTTIWLLSYIYRLRQPVQASELALIHGNAYRACREAFLLQSQGGRITALGELVSRILHVNRVCSFSMYVCMYIYIYIYIYMHQYIHDVCSDERTTHSSVCMCVCVLVRTWSRRINRCGYL